MLAGRGRTLFPLSTSRSQETGMLFYKYSNFKMFFLILSSREQRINCFCADKKLPLGVLRLARRGTLFP